MSYKLNLIVPFAVPPDVVEDVKDYLIKHFGGYSAYPINGAWYDGVTTIIEDSVLFFCITGQPYKHVQETGLWLEEFIKCNTLEIGVMWWIEEVTK